MSTSINPGKQDNCPVVLLHSSFFNARQFDPLRELLAPRHCYTPTYRGQNGVPAGNRPITMEALAEDLVLDLRARFAEPVHVVGNAMGAFVAAHACAQAPQLFRSAALLNATVLPERDPGRFTVLEQKMVQQGPARMAPTIAQMMFGKTFTEENPDEVARWTDVFAQADVTIVETIRAIYNRTELRPVIAALTVPLLLLAGAEDRVRTPDELSPAAADRPGSIFCTVPDAGHSMSLEQPRAVSRLLTTWWQSLLLG